MKNYELREPEFVDMEVALRINLYRAKSAGKVSESAGYAAESAGNAAGSAGKVPESAGNEEESAGKCETDRAAGADNRLYYNKRSDYIR